MGSQASTSQQSGSQSSRLTAPVELVICVRSLGSFNCQKVESVDRKGQSDVHKNRIRNWHLNYPGAQVASILGLTDLFGVASGIALDLRPLRVTHWRPINEHDANLSCVYDSAPHGSPQPRTLVIPPTMVNLPDPDVPVGVVSWVRNCHAAGATLVSLCSGAFILAKTGLVDGRSVATHQDSAQRRWRSGFRKSSSIQIGASLIMATSSRRADSRRGWSVGLFLVDRILGPAMRVQTARFVLSDPAAGEARYFTGFAPPQTHRDRAVLKAQEWVHMRDGRRVSLGAMAVAAGLERRTLLRRFATATGMTPIEYCRAVRVAHTRAPGGRGHLAEADCPIHRLQGCGLICARFSRKSVGLAPRDSRKRFGRNGISPADFATPDSSRKAADVSGTPLRPK